MNMLYRMLFVLVCFASCTGSGNNEQPAEVKASGENAAIENGKQVFYARCASCHMINRELTGPALRGVEGRWPDKNKLYAFIRNSEAVIKEDSYARELWLKYNQTMMNPHPDLTDKQIDDLLIYINSVSEPSNQ